MGKNSYLNTSGVFLKRTDSAKQAPGVQIPLGLVDFTIIFGHKKL